MRRVRLPAGRRRRCAAGDRRGLDRLLVDARVADLRRPRHHPHARRHAARRAGGHARHRVPPLAAPVGGDEPGRRARSTNWRWTTSRETYNDERPTGGTRGRRPTRRRLAPPAEGPPSPPVAATRRPLRAPRRGRRGAPGGGRPARRPRLPVRVRALGPAGRPRTRRARLGDRHRPSPTLAGRGGAARRRGAVAAAAARHGPRDRGPRVGRSARSPAARRCQGEARGGRPAPCVPPEPGPTAAGDRRHRARDDPDPRRLAEPAGRDPSAARGGTRSRRGGRRARRGRRRRACGGERREPGPASRGARARAARAGAAPS